MSNPEATKTMKHSIKPAKPYKKENPSLPESVYKIQNTVV